MENYVLYEETDRYSNTIVYKGRKKGEISFVSIYCIEKCRRPEVTNRVRLTYEICHKNIVRFYEWYETNNHLWLVVELCSGGTLERIIQQDTFLPENVSLRFASGVAAGLYHCHSVGILFGPVRPSRILLDSLGIFKLADFGMSKMDGENLVDILKHQFCEEGEDYDIQPPDLQDAYRAPELESFDWSVASDLYSFGVLLYHLYTGTTPPQNGSLTWQGANKSKLCPSDEFRDLVCGLLVNDPVKRYTWSDILGHTAFGERLTALINDGQTLLDSETATGSGEEHSGNEDYGGDQGDVTPRASQMVLAEETEETVTDIGSARMANVDINVSRPSTACGRGGLLGDSKLVGKSGTSLMASRPSTAGRLTPCQALDSGPVETRTARTPQHAVLTAMNTANAVQNLGSGYEPDDAVDWGNLQLFHESDFAVTSIVDNQRIAKTGFNTKFDVKLLPVQQITAEKLAALPDRDKQKHIHGLIEHICGTNEKGPMSARRINHINYCTIFFGTNSLACDKLLSLGGLSTIFKIVKETNLAIEQKHRILHLLAVICGHLSSNGIREDAKAVAELISLCNSVGELLRDTYHQRQVRLAILPCFGEVVYAIVRCTPALAAGDVHSTVSTLILRCLKETDCPTTGHYAAKIIENVMACPRSASGNPLLRRFLTGESLQLLWGLFSNCNVDALKISCTLALTRMLIHDAALVGPLLELVSLAGILDPIISSQSARVHQSLITILCVALCRTPKLASSKEVLDALLFEMEHTSPIVRAKGYLGFSLVVRHNPDMLMYCTQSRLSTHLERDFQKAVSLATRHEYLEHGVVSAVASLAALPSKLNRQAIEVLHHVSLKQHPTTAQTKQLNAALPGVAVVAYLISCSLIRQQVTDAAFVSDMIELCNALIDAMAAVGAHPHQHTASSTIVVVVEDLRQGVLAALEATVQSAAADQQAVSQLSYFPLLDPLSRLVSDTFDAGLQAAGLRLLTDLLPAVFKVEKSIENMRLSDLLRAILPTLDRLFFENDPLPPLAASFLLGACHVSPKVVRTLATTFHTLGILINTLESYKRRPTLAIVQHLLEIFDLILAQSSVDFSQFLNKKFVEIMSTIYTCLSESAGLGGYEVPPNGLDAVARPLLATLSIIHNMLRHVALAARRAIQARQQGGGSTAQEVAEEALKGAKGLTCLDFLLVNLLVLDDGDFVDMAANILSLMAQLYGPSELAGALTEDNVSAWIAVLAVGPNLPGPPPSRAKSLLRTLRRLVQMPDDSIARYTALNSDGLLRAIDKLSTAPLASTSASETSTTTEANNVSMLAHEIMVSLTKSHNT